MLIKIKDHSYINSEHIVMLAPTKNTHRSGEYLLFLAGVPKPFRLDADSAAYIITVLDANQGFTEAVTPVTLPLPSQIAIYLRDLPNGATFTEITDTLPPGTNDIHNAIATLLNEAVIKEKNGRYFHSGTLGTQQW